MALNRRRVLHITLRKRYQVHLTKSGTMPRRYGRGDQSGAALARHLVGTCFLPRDAVNRITRHAYGRAYY